MVSLLPRAPSEPQSTYYRTIQAHRSTNFILGVAAYTIAERDTVTDSTWSKEALFGLLGVLFVILVPCVALFLKYVIFKCRIRGRRISRKFHITKTRAKQRRCAEVIIDQSAEDLELGRAHQYWRHIHNTRRNKRTSRNFVLIL